MKRAVLYMRVSTVDQHPETQLHDLRALAAQRGLEIIREYTDRSGIAVERTGALLVAWDDDQRAALPALADKARANGYAAIRERCRKKAAQLWITWRCCSSANSGYIGKASTSRQASSLAGKSPSW